MAVVIVNEIEGGGQDLYDRASPKLFDGGNLPDGCQVHIAGPYKNGWRVISVWDSEETFQQFREEKLIPTLQEAGGEDRVASNISTDPVHKLIAG